MKSLPLFLLLLLLAAPLAAQNRDSQNESAAGQKESAAGQKAAPAKQQTKSQGTDFVDEDGDGINDLLQNSGATNQQGEGQQLRQRRRDRFVDQDGDGINDERCSGTGIRQGRRYGAPKGGGQ